MDLAGCVDDGDWGRRKRGGEVVVCVCVCVCVIDTREQNEYTAYMHTCLLACMRYAEAYLSKEE